MKFQSRDELSVFIQAEVSKAVRASTGPHVTTGPVGRDSAGYSLSRAAALSTGALDPSQAKEEVRVSDRLRAMYSQCGMSTDPRAVLVPTGSALLPDAALGAEIRDMTRAAGEKYDPDEARWAYARAAGYDKKALSAGAFTAGGSLAAGTQPFEFIDVQRNYEVFANAGAREVPLNERGGFSVPRLSGSATAYWMGESSTVTDSQPTTGSLELQAKKIGALVTVNNTLLKLGGPSADYFVRHDMARAAALKADLAMLEGAGGTQIRGVITYSGIGQHTAGVTATNGDTFQTDDVAKMEAKLPDGADATVAWVMRKSLFAALMNRRADAVTAADGKGAYLFRDSSTRGGLPRELRGTPVIRSNQVSGARTKGSGTTLTYALLGHFSDWLIGRLGVMEFIAGHGDTTLANDQTLLLGTQYIDAGPRNPASFVLCDQLLQA